MTEQFKIAKVVELYSKKRSIFFSYYEGPVYMDNASLRGVEWNWSKKNQPKTIIRYLNGGRVTLKIKISTRLSCKGRGGGGGGSSPPPPPHPGKSYFCI